MSEDKKYESEEKKLRSIVIVSTALIGAEGGARPGA